MLSIVWLNTRLDVVAKVFVDVINIFNQITLKRKITPNNADGLILSLREQRQRSPKEGVLLLEHNIRILP